MPDGIRSRLDAGLERGAKPFLAKAKERAARRRPGGLRWRSVYATRLETATPFSQSSLQEMSMSSFQLRP